MLRRVDVEQRERLVAVGRFGDDLELGPDLGELLLQPLAHQRLVLGDQRGRTCVAHGVAITGTTARSTAAPRAATRSAR